MLNLLVGLRAQTPPTLAIDLVAIKACNVAVERLPEGVRLVDAGTAHSTWSAPALARYLRRERPTALLAAKDRAIRSAVVARRPAGAHCRLVGRLATDLCASLEGKNAAARWLRCRPMRWIYPHTDAIVAVSEGVAADTRRVTGLTADRVTVVRNPVVTLELPARAAAEVDHPWLGGELPVVLGAGRLTRQKDFSTLIRAFARLRKTRPVRLLILGDGPEREPLMQLAQTLGIDGDLDLPGHVDNPHAWMAKADLFVLSSAWEGSPNVLTEALACGTPVVSTDCPSGPREVLADGRYGPLVPVGDDAALAAAMLRTLDRPLPAATLQEAVREYTVATSARGYLRVLGLLD